MPPEAMRAACERSPSSGSSCALLLVGNHSDAGPARPSGPIATEPARAEPHVSPYLALVFSTGLRQAVPPVRERRSEIQQNGGSSGDASSGVLRHGANHAGTHATPAGCALEHVGLCHPAHSDHHPGHAGGRLLRLQLALHRARRPRRDHRRRPGHPRRRRAHPRLARPGPAVPGPLRRMAVADPARRPRHLDLHQPAGRPHDRAAHRADAVADGADHDLRHRHRHPAGRGGGVEARHAGSTAW